MKIISVLLCAICVVTPAMAESQRYFEEWPARANPTEVGRRVTERFLALPHMLWSEFGTLHYAEVATWYGALTYGCLPQHALGRLSATSLTIVDDR